MLLFCIVDDEITVLSKRLVEANNLDEARSLARELQKAIRDRVDKLHSHLNQLQESSKKAV